MKSNPVRWGRFGHGVLAVALFALGAVACDQPGTTMSAAPNEAVTSIESVATQPVVEATQYEHPGQDDPLEAAPTQPALAPPIDRLTWQRPARHAEAAELKLRVEGPRGLASTTTLPTSATGIDVTDLGSELPDGLYTFRLEAWPTDTVRPAPPEPEDSDDPGFGLTARERIAADAFIESTVEEELLDDNGRDIRDGEWKPATHDGLLTHGDFWIRDGAIVAEEGR